MSSSAFAGPCAEASTGGTACWDWTLDELSNVAVEGMPLSFPEALAYWERLCSDVNVGDGSATGDLWSNASTAAPT